MLQDLLETKVSVLFCSLHLEAHCCCVNIKVNVPSVLDVGRFYLERDPTLAQVEAEVKMCSQLPFRYKRWARTEPGLGGRLRAHGARTWGEAAGPWRLVE